HWHDGKDKSVDELYVGGRIGEHCVNNLLIVVALTPTRALAVRKRLVLRVEDVNVPSCRSYSGADDVRARPNPSKRRAKSSPPTALPQHGVATALIVCQEHPQHRL